MVSRAAKTVLLLLIQDQVGPGRRPMATHVGLDRHIYEQSTAKQNEDPNSKSSDAEAIKNITHKDIPSSNNLNDKLASLHPSQVSHPSQSKDKSTATKIMNAKNSSIYRTSEHSDTFACSNCRLRGDRFFMEVHKCSIKARK